MLSVMIVIIDVEENRHETLKLEEVLNMKNDITIDERLSLSNYVSSRMNAKEYVGTMINLFFAEKQQIILF